MNCTMWHLCDMVAEKIALQILLFLDVPVWQISFDIML